MYGDVGAWRSRQIDARLAAGQHVDDTSAEAVRIEGEAVAAEVHMSRLEERKKAEFRHSFTDPRFRSGRVVPKLNELA